MVQLAQYVKEIIERLAAFLKQRELKGITKIFFRNGRLILELLLYKCKIDITYSVLTEGLSTQVIVITATAGGTTGFIVSWLSAGATIIAPPVLISFLFIRSFVQQLINEADYLKFKQYLERALNDDELRETLRTYFMKGEPPSYNTIQMGNFDSENSPPIHNPESEQTLAEFIKSRIKEELGLIENPTEDQLYEIVHRKRRKKKSKSKTVLFSDFINRFENNLGNLSNPDEILDAEIMNKSLEIKVKNE